MTGPEAHEVFGKVARADADSVSLFDVINVTIDTSRLQGAFRYVTICPALSFIDDVCCIPVLCGCPKPEDTEGGPQVFVGTLYSSVNQTRVELVGHARPTENPVGWMNVSARIKD
jgi:hypothetical protein